MKIHYLGFLKLANYHKEKIPNLSTKVKKITSRKSRKRIIGLECIETV
jgi:hypothetical protein